MRRIWSRNGVMDGLGLRTFDASTFENTLEQLIPHLSEQNHCSYSVVGPINSPRHLASRHQMHSPSHEKPEHFLDDLVASYRHGYPHSRPVHPFPLHLTAIQQRHRHHLSSQNGLRGRYEARSSVL